jgi:hypothetical protein
MMLWHSLELMKQHLPNQPGQLIALQQNSNKVFLIEPVNQLSGGI